MDGRTGSSTMILETRAVAPFYKNGFVLGCEDTREGIVIDPGDEVEDLAVRRSAAPAGDSLHPADPRSHRSHHRRCGCKEGARRTRGPPPGETSFSTRPSSSRDRCSACRAEPQPDVDFFYDGSGPWRFGRYGAWVYHTPGHCPGGVCLAVGREPTRPARCLSGTRCLRDRSAASIYRAAIFETLLNSIRTVLFSFPDDTVVYPGHGEPTTVGVEKRTNPF